MGQGGIKQDLMEYRMDEMIKELKQGPAQPVAAKAPTSDAAVQSEKIDPLGHFNPLK